MNKTAEDVIQALKLEPLPEEGGFFRETYRAQQSIPGTERCYSTQIYYLVTPEEFSGLHRVNSADEIFHFYMGDPVEMLQITDDGEKSYITLGQNLEDEHIQVVVPAKVWQGTRLKNGGRWALLGCTVAPGFEFEDFEVKTREDFLQLFPQHEKDVLNYTRPS